MEPKEEFIKKGLIIDMLIDKLYDCLVVEQGKIDFSKYDLSSKDIMYLLKHYDSERFDAYSKLLLNEED